ncbi:hypothetical protein [Thalassobacillus pellis]|uniref:hypothetical protein n=1 Tax=Thalassobacillus pellis TaxID=748008 RepID=UPI0019617D62|nr:hypothetical protein [Thalassobacillus pellis]MBM7553429.1 hypothetical protein [Thalassobacillus pellis]
MKYRYAILSYSSILINEVLVSLSNTSDTSTVSTPDTVLVVFKNQTGKRYAPRP